MLAGYRVIKLLGRGGMGEVWAAAKPDSDEQVAIKVLLPNAAVQPALVARFAREAKVSAAIQSDYVCKLLDAQRDDSGAHLLIFEKLEGESLSQRLKRETYLPFAEVGPIIDDTLQGLRAAHAMGVIHRDLKPANLFLEWSGDPEKPERAKILDFGISKLTRKDGARRDEPSLTDFDATLGSFAYMAPEQVRGAARADLRADIYALGVVAFRALAGRLPFTANNAGMLIALKLDRVAPTLSEITDEHWPAGLERFLTRALSRDPGDRHSSADEALAEWRSCLPAHLARRNQPPPQSTTGDAPVDGQSHTAATWGHAASVATEVDFSHDPTE